MKPPLFAAMIAFTLVQWVNAVDAPKPSPASDEVTHPIAVDPHSLRSTNPVSLFYSTGDSIVEYKWLPIHSKATCDAAFETLRKRYNCDRIFWRDAAYEAIAKWDKVRLDAPWLGDQMESAMRMSREYRTSENAAAAAKASGIQFWGAFSLFDYCGKATCGAGGTMSRGAYWGQEPWLDAHPEYRLWDRARITYLTGAVEYGNPEVRQEYVRRIDQMLDAEWSKYEGLLVWDFIENHEAQYTDQYIYSDYAIADFKNRYGIDVRTQPFDLQAYYAMRGQYITQYLKDLRPVFLKHKKKLAWTLNGANMEWPQLWLAGRSQWPKDRPNEFVYSQGLIKMDWRTWVKENLVDELLVWGGVSSRQKLQDVDELLGAAKGSNTTVSVMFQNEFPADRQSLYSAGVRRAVSLDPGNEDGDLVKRPATDVDSSDAQAVLNVLAQARNKQIVLAPEKLSALLLQHPNPLVRRQAANIIGMLQIRECVPGLDQAAANDSEGAVKAMAIDALGKVNGPNSVSSMAAGFAKINTFPVRMALRTALAAMGPERYADIVASFDTTDEYYRRVLAESLTRHAGLPEYLPLVHRALKDPSDKVRYWAAFSLLYYPASEENSRLLISALDDPSGLVQTRAALTLKGRLSKASHGLQQQCYDKLMSIYQEFRSPAGRADAEWGWLPIGQAIRDGFGDEGKQSLLKILNADYSPLAKLSWQVLFLPNDFGAWQPFEREKMERLYRFYPGAADHGKCALADVIAVQDALEQTRASRKKAPAKQVANPAKADSSKPASTTHPTTRAATKPRDIRVGIDVKTIREAIKQASPGDTIHLQPIVYHDYAGFYGKSGEPGLPITFDGHGATLEGSDPLDPAVWKEVGPGLFANDNLLPRLDDAVMVRFFFLWDGKMNLMGRTSKGKKAPFKKVEDLQVGQWTFIEDKDREAKAAAALTRPAKFQQVFGTFYVKIPPGQKLIDAHIAAPMRSAGVQMSSNNTYLVIKNLTCTHPYNDGFNIHGHCDHVEFKNIRAIECGDDGVSAHETAEYTVDGLVSIGNSTGITDTVAAHTSYNHVFIAGIHAFDLFFLNNGRYKVENAVILSSSEHPLSVAATGADEHCELTLNNVYFRRLGKTEPGNVSARSKLQATKVTTSNMQITSKGEVIYDNCVIDGKSVPANSGATGADLAKLVREVVPAEYQSEFSDQLK